MAEVQTVSGPTLRLSNVRKKFDHGATALDDLSLTVAQGEFVSVVGPSGCGKSTLLRVIAGLTRATSGDVRCNTDDVGVRESQVLAKGPDRAVSVD